MTKFNSHKITEREFRHWYNEISKTHTIYSRPSNDNSDTTIYFIEDVGLNQVEVLMKYTVYKHTHYYKNTDIVGEE